MDLAEKEYTYSNIQIAHIRRLLNNMLIDGDGYDDSEIVNIALELMRILIEISSGALEYDEEEWDSFLDAQKDEKSLIIFIRDLKIASQIKNTLLNEIANAKSKKEIYDFFNEYKETYHGD